MSENMDTGPSGGGGDPRPSGSRGLDPQPKDYKEVPLPPGVCKERYRIKNGAIALYALGDSHLRKGSFFPKLYADARAGEETDPRFSALNRQLHWETEDSRYESGYCLTEAYLAQLLELVESKKGKATAYFLSIGTNDLREAKRDGKEEEVERLMGHFRTLMNRVMETPGAVLFILEPIPCNKGIGTERDQLDQELEAECRKHRKVRYVTLSHGEKPDLIKKNGSFHQEKHWKDQIHFNAKGSSFVVKALIRAQKETSSEFFLVDKQAREIRGHAARHDMAQGRYQAGPGPYQPQGWRPQGPQPSRDQGHQRPWQNERRSSSGHPGLQSGRVEKTYRPQAFRGQAAPQGSIHRRIGYFTAPEKQQAPRNDKSPPRRAPLRDPRLNEAYYHAGRMAAKAAYDEKIKEIDRAEQDGRPFEEEKAVEPPTPYCRPYQEQPRDDRDPGGPGGYGQFMGYGHQGPMGPYGPLPPIIIYQYPHPPPPPPQRS
jgi:lysophospholipase L1-like esterase